MSGLILVTFAAGRIGRAPPEAGSPGRTLRLLDVVGTGAARAR